MALKPRQHSEAESDYVTNTSLRCPKGMSDLIAATEKTDHPGMATALTQGQFLAFLIKAIGGARVLEVGVFTGVTTWWMAEAVGPNGKVVACDVSAEYTSIGKPFWKKAGISDRIDLRLAPAAETLQALVDAQEAPFDFCYIDADKDGYDTYYELVLKLLRPGGIIAFDNMLMGGRVADPENDTAAVVAIRTLNEKLHADTRVDMSFLQLGDGVSLVRKR